MHLDCILVCEVKVTVTKKLKTVVSIALPKLFAIIHNVTPHVIQIVCFLVLVLYIYIETKGILFNFRRLAYAPF